ncbi:hypothetical protein MNV49_006263 [Pseudohyphozyma bogoriensis]|nr:hypothetical protein MNV49_006263 [Pseudohyphozyma bogoriensis]
MQLWQRAGGATKRANTVVKREDGSEQGEESKEEEEDVKPSVTKLDEFDDKVIHAAVHLLSTICQTGDLRFTLQHPPLSTTTPLALDLVDAIAHAFPPSHPLLAHLPLPSPATTSTTCLPSTPPSPYSPASLPLFTPPTACTSCCTSASASASTSPLGGEPNNAVPPGPTSGTCSDPARLGITPYLHHHQLEGSVFEAQFDEFVNTEMWDSGAGASGGQEEWSGVLF